MSVLGKVWKPREAAHKEAAGKHARTTKHLSRGASIEIARIQRL